MLPLLVLILTGCSGPPTVPLFVPSISTPLPQPQIKHVTLPTLFPTSTMIPPILAPSQTANAAPHLTPQAETAETPAIAFAIANQRPGQHAYYYINSQNVEINFLMYLPNAYAANKKWPMILYLHSSIEEGSDINLVRQRALPKKLENETDFPFIVISPQIANGYWYQYADTLENLIDELEHALPIDTRREYLTGFSLGGYGTWAYAYHYPNRFAAIVPVAGSLDENESFMIPINFCQMKGVAAWAFHGDLDVNVSPNENIALIQALSNCGGEAKITQYPQVRHLLAAELAYDEPGLYNWLLAHSK